MGNTFKIFELNLLRQSGVMVTAQQVGLKTDPFASIQLRSASSMFGNMLSQMGGTGNVASSMALSTAMTPPVPPTPPADPTNAAAQAKYQQDMLTYQSNFQIYNQRFMQLMLNQMSNMQMSMRNAAYQSSNLNSSSGSSSSSSSSGSDYGIGSII